MADEEVGGLPHLADRLNILFARVPGRNGKQPYSNDRAAEDLSSAGVTVTGAYLSQLRSGKKSNPSARLLAGIADLFGVSITYFFDERKEAQIERELDAIVALRNAGIRNIVERTAGMSEAGIASLAVVQEQLRRMEGLDSSTGRGSHRAGDAAAAPRADLNSVELDIELASTDPEH